MKINPMYHHTADRIQEEMIWVEQAKLNPEKFAPLYKKYQESIFRYVHQRVDDTEMALDVTSQVFMKALNNIHKFEHRGVPFGSWLFRIAKSELYQSFRDRQARRTVNIDTVIIQDILEEKEDEDLEIHKKNLLKALSTLKSDTLRIVEMRFFEKKTFKEIGEILNITENNAKVKCFRALIKLRIHFVID
jgi:RNA polymerase sigma-70 factor (ECF subfamily)